jgi:alkylation response protein AidB-like acyl-CoA dehydrogenase
MGVEGQRALVEERIDALLATHPPASQTREEFLAARFDTGLAWVWFPEGEGGLGVRPEFQTLADRRCREAGAQPTFATSLGYMMAGTTIATFGTAEQKSRYLKPTYSDPAMRWCQLFSEPGAGSDLGGLSTRAERDGDEWRVNGQKVWSSDAHVATMGLLVARSDPNVPKHQGLTYFVVDMESPGIEVRALRNMAGTAEFNETFFTDVRIPDANRLGEVGEGWRVALSTLMNERVNFVADIDGAGAPRADHTILEAIRLFRERSPDDAVRRDDLLRLWARYEVLGLTARRAAEHLGTGTPGPEGSVGKLLSTELTKDVASFCVDVLGAEGMLFPGRYPLPREQPGPATAGDVRFLFVEAPSNTIMGGTSEIQRNNLAERVLGLPGDIRVDKGVPWVDIPRNA